MMDGRNFGIGQRDESLDAPPLTRRRMPHPANLCRFSGEIGRPLRKLILAYGMISIHLLDVAVRLNGSRPAHTQSWGGAVGTKMHKPRWTRRRLSRNTHLSSRNGAAKVWKRRTARESGELRPDSAANPLVAQDDLAQCYDFYWPMMVVSSRSS